MYKKDGISFFSSKVLRVFFIIVFAFILLTPQNTTTNARASSTQMALNLHVIINPDSVTLKWDDVYPDYWYVPEKEIGELGFFPLVDIPIREDEFEYNDYGRYTCFRLRVVDREYNEIAITDEKVCAWRDEENPLPNTYDIEEDGDCRCLLVLSYQIGTKHANAYMGEEERYLESRENPPVLENGSLSWVPDGHRINREPIIKNGRVFVEAEDVLKFTPNSSWQLNEEEQMFSMSIPKTMYPQYHPYTDDTKPFHYTTVELKIGKDVALIDGRPQPIDWVDNDVTSYIEKDDDGIDHLMVPLRFMAEITGAKDIVWLPEYKIPMITYDVNDCGCQIEGRNNDDPNTYDNWDVELTNIKIDGEPADSSYFSTDGSVPDEILKSTTSVSMDFSIINNNERPITFTVKTPDIETICTDPDNIDPNNLDPIIVKPGEKSNPINLMFGINDWPDENIKILQFSLVYKKGEYIEKEGTIKTVTVKTGKCCYEMDYMVDIKLPDSPYCFSPGDEVSGIIEIKNNCFREIRIRLIPSKHITKHSLPDNIIELGSEPYTSTEIPLLFTVPDNISSEETFQYLRVIQIDKDGNDIDDCEEKFWLRYCEE